MARLTQQQLLEIFNALKKEMKPYETGTVKPYMDIEGRYDLRSEKEVFAAGKMRPEIGFVAIILQSGYVGFYYTPIYCNPVEIRPKLSEEFLKLLKGKACFHIKQVDEQLLENVRYAMKIGAEQYRKNGWL